MSSQFYHCSWSPNYFLFFWACTLLNSFHNFLPFPCTHQIHFIKQTLFAHHLYCPAFFTPVPYFLQVGFLVPLLWSFLYCIFHRHSLLGPSCPFYGRHLYYYIRVSHPVSHYIILVYSLVVCVFRSPPCLSHL